jgi:glyoxylase-like metal-dependent hydrolase (beta-lactamase superfamily II)
METFTTIDLNWAGRPQSIAALLIESNGTTAIIDPGPQSTLNTLRSGLEARGINLGKIDFLLLTHIHLDHAGATGALVRENPALQIYVHEIGVPHMQDPSRLLASAGRLYGGEMQSLYGDCAPVPEANLRSLKGGEELLLGDLRITAHYTPGHASHHVSYWDAVSRTAFVGDTAGIRVQGNTFLLPATPPPDIDVEVWNHSLETISSWSPERIFLTHFGFIENPREHIGRYRERLREWTALSGKLVESGLEISEAEKVFVESVAAEVEAELPPDEAEHYIFNGGLRLSWLGLMRYARKRAAGK